jgi:hypothetical protein
MATITNFRFNDVVLYAKGWYESSGNLLKDLEKYIKRNEDYWYPKTMSRREVMNYMLKALDELYQYLSKEELTSPHYCHSHFTFITKVEYYERLYKIDFEEAVCMVVYSILQNLDRTQIILNPPKYDKHHKYGGGLFGKKKQGMTYKEMNRLWQQRNS